MKKKNIKKTAAKETDAEKFVRSVQNDDNVTANTYLSKIVQKKCEERFKKILAAEKNADKSK